MAPGFSPALSLHRRNHVATETDSTHLDFLPQLLYGWHHLDKVPLSDGVQDLVDGQTHTL